MDDNDLSAVIERYWATAEGRDWAAFGELLADDVVYEMPQTRERVRGREAYLRFNREYPGDWHIDLRRVAASPDDQGVSWVVATVGADSEDGLTFFDFDGDGRITHVTDFWPQPYEPPTGREHLVERY
jgi:ketosteroid isomerase-like protein